MGHDSHVKHLLQNALTKALSSDNDRLHGLPAL
jgi:hypothetical protein